MRRSGPAKQAGKRAFASCSIHLRVLHSDLNVCRRKSMAAAGSRAMSDADETDRYRAPALDKGLDILELLAAEDGAFTQVEIAKALGRTPNEIYRMLDRLVRRGYVSRN